MRRLWLDCDPGLDDWLTLLMLATLPDADWVGTSVVAGNAPLAVTLDNALRIRHHYGLATPVYAGCAQALAGTVETAQRVLGAQGMRSTGALLPAAPVRADGDDAVAALLAALRAGRLTLLAIGPLTNVATALQREPAAAQQIDEIVLMGGSTDRGNHTAAAEFNFYADPEAADAVFRSGVPVRMFGLNLCRQVLLERQHVAQVQQWPGPRAQWLAGYLDAYQRIRSSDGAVPMPVYDPVVAAWLHAPGLFRFSPAQVDIELHGRFTRGMSVCNFKLGPGQQPNAQVAQHADGPAVLALLMQSLAQGCGAAPPTAR
ncbi:MAG: hypothetical protein RLZZ401_2145 [Pseudomonadota bacterium]|jgi:purine nucleosidase